MLKTGDGLYTCIIKHEIRLLRADCFFLNTAMHNLENNENRNVRLNDIPIGEIIVV